MTRKLMPVRREDVNSQGQRHGVEIPPDFNGGRLRRKIATEPMADKMDEKGKGKKGDGIPDGRIK